MADLVIIRKGLKCSTDQGDNFKFNFFWVWITKILIWYVFQDVAGLAI